MLFHYCRVIHFDLIAAIEAQLGSLWVQCQFFGFHYY